MCAAKKRPLEYSSMFTRDKHAESSYALCNNHESLVRMEPQGAQYFGKIFSKELTYTGKMHGWSSTIKNDSMYVGHSKIVYVYFMFVVIIGLGRSGDKVLDRKKEHILTFLSAYI